MNKNEINKIQKFFKDKNFDQAETYLKELIRNEKDNLKYQNLLSIVLINKGKNNQAKEILKDIIKKKPNYIDAIKNLGNLYSDLGLYDKAEIYFEKALAIEPNNIIILEIYASTLIHLNKYNESTQILKNLLKKNPKHTDALINLGVVNLEKNNFDQARNYFEKAKQTNKDDYKIYYNLGLLEDKKNNSEEAIKNFAYAINLNSTHAQSYYNLACIYQGIGNVEEAYLNFKTAIKIRPDYIDAIINLSRLDLSKLNFNSGWLGYELRQGGVGKTYNILNIDKKNIWDGRKTKKNIIVHGEQGLGDQILFCSALRELKNYCNNVSVTLDKRLLGVMKRSFSEINFLDKLESIKIEEKNTKNILLGSIAQFLRKKENDFKSNKIPWLSASNNKIKEIEKIFSFTKKLKVGLSWKGSSLKRVNRQIDLQELVKIFDTNKYELINLQHSDYLEDINLVSKKLNRDILFEEKFDYKEDLEGIIALINKCDLIITLGNTVAHLSSALGKKTYVLVASNAQWYWLSEHKKKLWYPNCNVLISKNNNNWSESLDFLKNVIQNN